MFIHCCFGGTQCFKMKRKENSSNNKSVSLTLLATRTNHNKCTYNYLADNEAINESMNNATNWPTNQQDLI